MKQMTKEELIEYFIEQLGNNEILGQVMSIEQIRKKLTNIIKDVTYNDEQVNSAGRWVTDENGTGTINFNLRKISLRDENKIIVHELLHALSTSVTANTDKWEKCGIEYVQKKYGNDGTLIDCFVDNVAINEGMTDTLAETITTGIYNNGYVTEKDIYKIVSIIVGEETMLKKYFSEDAYANNLPTNIFRKDLIEKYGEILGEEINYDLGKVLHLSDQLLNLSRNDNLHGLSKFGKNIQSQTKDEKNATLENMINKIIENEPDIMTKINDILIPLSATSLKDKFSERILSQLMDSKEFGLDEKLAILKNVKQAKASNIPEIILERILENNHISSEKKLEIYMSLKSGNILTEKTIDRLYELYIETGRIDESMFPKREIFEYILKDSRLNPIKKTDEGRVVREFTFDTKRIDEILEKYKYNQVGQYYIIKTARKDLIVGHDGHIINIEKDKNFQLMNWYPLDDDEITEQSDIEILSQLIPEDKISVVSSQLRERCKQQYLECEKNGEGVYFPEIFVNESSLILRNSKNRVYITLCNFELYSINSNGNLELIPQRFRT